MQQPNHSSWIIGDGHVHIHDSFALDKLFGAALDNFAQHAQSLGFQGTVHHFLLLTESAGTEAFVRLQESPDLVDGFTVQPTAEANCLHMVSNQGATLFIVAGRQIVTAESLEVLALGLDRPYPDNQPIQQILSELAKDPCLLVLPWGAGKWLGKRGTIMEQTVQSFRDPSFFLGDNGNRPYFWPRPALFSRAASLGTANLQGSDPLPFPHQEQRVGSFGFYLPGSVEPGKPFGSLTKLVMAPENSVQSYGKAERALPFFHLQISMQLSKHLP